MPTRWKLKSFLDANDITVYKLSMKTEGALSRNTLYSLTGDKPPTRLEIKTLDVLIPALRALTGKDIEVSDLLEFEDYKSVKGGNSNAG